MITSSSSFSRSRRRSLVLKANGDGRAHAVLAQACELLQARAAVIEDEKLRASYLEKIPAHQQIQVE